MEPKKTRKQPKGEGEYATHALMNKEARTKEGRVLLPSEEGVEDAKRFSEENPK